MTFTNYSVKKILRSNGKKKPKWRRTEQLRPPKTTSVTKTKGKGGQPSTPTVIKTKTQVPGKGANTKGQPWWPNQTRQQESSSADPKGMGKKKGK